MSKRLVNKLAIVRERRRLTAEYLEWARTTGAGSAITNAKRDLARHERELAKLERRLYERRTMSQSARVRRLLLDLMPIAVFILTASLITGLGRWDAGLVGLLNGLGAVLIYLYFAKDTGRLRI